MQLESAVSKCIRAHFYVPASLDVERFKRNLLHMAGGYTVHPTAWGVWQDGADKVEEPVHVYEAVVTGKHFSYVLEHSQVAMAKLMYDNPKEKCAMAVVNGRCVTLTRKDN